MLVNRLAAVQLMATHDESVETKLKELVVDAHTLRMLSW